jgi:hypothetical protein
VTLRRPSPDCSCRRPSMYQKSINPRCTGLCCPVRAVSTCPHITSARWHNPTRSGTSRNSLISPSFGFASRGSWVRFPSSPPVLTRRDSPIGTPRKHRCISQSDADVHGGASWRGKRQVNRRSANSATSWSCVSMASTLPPEITARANSGRSRSTVDADAAKWRTIRHETRDRTNGWRPQRRPSRSQRCCRHRIRSMFRLCGEVRVLPCLRG